MALDILPSHRGGFPHLPRFKRHHQLARFIDFNGNVVLQSYFVRICSGVQRVSTLGDAACDGVVAERDAIPQADVAHVTQVCHHSLRVVTRPVTLRQDILHPHKLDLQRVVTGCHVHRIRAEAEHMPPGGELQQLGPVVALRAWDLVQPLLHGVHPLVDGQGVDRRSVERGDVLAWFGGHVIGRVQAKTEVGNDDPVDIEPRIQTGKQHALFQRFGEQTPALIALPPATTCGVTEATENTGFLRSVTAFSRHGVSPFGPGRLVGPLSAICS